MERCGDFAAQHLLPEEEGSAIDLKNISPELREKAKACTTPEELLELAKKEGYKLSEDELGAVSGGQTWSCGEHDWYCTDDNFFGDARTGIDSARAIDAYRMGGLSYAELDW